MRRKTTFASIHVKNMTHVTELELNTRAFAPPFVHIPFIPVARTKECQECAKIFLQVGSSAVRFKNVPLTTESKISLRSRSCSSAIRKNRGPSILPWGTPQVNLLLHWITLRRQCIFGIYYISRMQKIVAHLDQPRSSQVSAKLFHDRSYRRPF